MWWFVEAVPSSVMLMFGFACCNRIKKWNRTFVPLLYIALSCSYSIHVLLFFCTREIPANGTYIPAIRLNQCSTSQVNNFRGGQGAVSFVFWSVVRIHFMHIAVLYYPRRVEATGIIVRWFVCLFAIKSTHLDSISHNKL